MQSIRSRLNKFTDTRSYDRNQTALLILVVTGALFADKGGTFGIVGLGISGVATVGGVALYIVRRRNHGVSEAKARNSQPNVRRSKYVVDDEKDLSVYLMHEAMFAHNVLSDTYVKSKTGALRYGLLHHAGRYYLLATQDTAKEFPKPRSAKLRSRVGSAGAMHVFWEVDHNEEEFGSKDEEGEHLERVLNIPYWDIERKANPRLH